MFSFMFSGDAALTTLAWGYLFAAAATNIAHSSFYTAVVPLEENPE